MENTNKVLELLGKSTWELRNAINHVYRGKVFIIAKDSRIQSFHKTKKGAENKMEKNKYFSYYDEYSMDMCYPHAGDFMVMITEEQLNKMINSKKFWFEYLRKELGHIINWGHMADQIKADAKALLGEENEIYTLVNEMLTEIVEKHCLSHDYITEEAEEAEEAPEVVETVEAVEGVKVVHNEEKQGVELYFEGKPEVEILTALKANKFRWHRSKKCWYAKESDQTKALINSYGWGQSPEVEEVAEVKKSPAVALGAVASNELVIPVPEAVEAVEVPELVEEVLKAPRSLQELIFNALQKELNKEGTETVEAEIVKELHAPIVTDLRDKEVIVKAEMPSINKNDSIEVNNQYIEESSYIEPFKVEKLVELNESDYNNFCNALLSDYDFLEGEGGNLLTEDGKFICSKAVVIICEGKEAVLVDPQGFNYARYTGRIVEDVNNSLAEVTAGKIVTDSDIISDFINKVELKAIYPINAEHEEILGNEYLIHNELKRKTFVTGHRLLQLLTSGEIKTYSIKKILEGKINYVDSFVNDLQGLENGDIQIIFPTKEHRELEQISFLTRYKNELKLIPSK